MLLLFFELFSFIVPFSATALIGRREQPEPKAPNIATAAKTNPSFGEAIDDLVARSKRTPIHIAATKAKPSET